MMLLLLKICLGSQMILDEILPSGFFSDTLPFSPWICLFLGVPKHCLSSVSAFVWVYFQGLNLHCISALKVICSIKSQTFLIEALNKLS